MKEAAIFDIDDTLIDGNTGKIYAMTFFKEGIIGIKDVFVMGLYVLSYSINRFDYGKAMKKAYSIVKGRDEAEIKNIIAKHHKTLVRPLINKKIKNELNRHKKKGRIIILATNSWFEMASPIAEDVKADMLLATEAVKKDGKFTGGIKKTCYGRNKMSRVKEFARENNIDLKKSYAYSDHYSDRWLLSIAGNPVAVNPDRKLRKHAAEKGWQVMNVR